MENKEQAVESVSAPKNTAKGGRKKKQPSGPDPRRRLEDKLEEARLQREIQEYAFDC